MRDELRALVPATARVARVRLFDRLDPQPKVCSRGPPHVT